MKGPKPIGDEIREAACRLYLKYGGRQHERIEREMREQGFGFNRMMLYKTSYAGGSSLGWPERFGWDAMLTPEQRNGLGKNNRGRNEFEQWLCGNFPEWRWRWKFQRLIYRKLFDMRNGGGRLMIFMPPRHGKSETVTIRHTAWQLLKNPKLNVIIGSYNQRLANKFSRKIRRLVLEKRRGGEEAKGRRGESLSPPLPITPSPLRAASEWETNEGGVVRAAGVGAGIAGFGAGLIVIDDPVRNRADAESQTYRDRVWEWFNDDIYTRMEPNASIILIQTRWHEDDLAGRLLREMEDGGEKWDVLSLAAIAEEEKGSEGEEEKGEGAIAPSPLFPVAPSLDELGREPGEALCPARYNIKALERIRRKLGAYSFSALYQQRPVPAEGGTFKREWFRRIVDKAPDGLRWKRGYDLAVSTKQTADYTASFRCAKDSMGNLYIADGFRARIEYPEQRRFIVDRMKAEYRTEHGIEAALHGAAFVQELRRDARLGHIALRSVKVDTDKLTRALAWMNLAEEGKVILVRGPWITDFLDEIAAFPTGKHDDQIDAVSLAVSMLAKPARNFYVFD